MPFSRGNAQQSGFEIVVNNFEALEKEFYEVLYPEIFWPQAIPLESVERNLDPGITHASYPVKDWSGAGEFTQITGGVTPLVGMSVSKPVVLPVLISEVGGDIPNEAVRNYRYAYPGAALDTEIAGIMRKACDRHIEQVFFYGNLSVGYDSWMDDPDIGVLTASSKGGGGTVWTNATADEILDDINNLLTTPWVESLQIHTPGRLYLPSAQFALITNKRLEDVNTTTVLEFIKEKNIYSSRTGQPLEIISIPHLTGAGLAGVDRMVVMEWTKENFKMPFPIPTNLLAPQPLGYNTKLFAEYKFGPFHCRYPAGAMYYMDGI